MSSLSNGEVYIVDGSRSPFLKAAGKQGPFSAADLATHVAKALIGKQPFAAHELDELIIGCVSPNENETNIARIVALRAGCGEKTPAFTVQRNCASGLQALDSAAKDIAIGRHDLVLAGGVEAMSHSPILFSSKMANWLGSFSRARSPLAKIQQLLKLKPNYFKPIIGLLAGLTDPICGLNMGQTAEKLAHQFNIPRNEMDAFSIESHRRAAQAQLDSLFDEIETIYDQKGTAYREDNGIRKDSTIEKLATLKPIFDRKFGSITAANSSQITDGAALLLLASANAVEKYKLKPLVRIIGIHWAALDPSVMGLGPVFASTPLLMQQKLSLSDIDYWEINEAFAAQVLACIKAWQDKAFCAKHFGLTQAVGTLNTKRLNIDGGAIALGHPVGASGARLPLHLLNILHRKKAKRGIATLCIGGGQGGAILLERV